MGYLGLGLFFDLKINVIFAVFHRCNYHIKDTWELSEWTIVTPGGRIWFLEIFQEKLAGFRFSTSYVPVNDNPINKSRWLLYFLFYDIIIRDCRFRYNCNYSNYIPWRIFILIKFQIPRNKVETYLSLNYIGNI